MLKQLLDRARRDTWIIEAVGAPFEVKDKLKRRGYRWNGDRRAWWIEVDDQQLQDEAEWATIHVYFGTQNPQTTRIDWTVFPISSEAKKSVVSRPSPLSLPGLKPVASWSGT